jgi:hypothetical protein
LNLGVQQLGRASRGLVEDMSNVLMRFDIGTRFKTVVTDRKTPKGTAIIPSHSVIVRNGDALRFADCFRLTKQAKQVALDNMRRVCMVNKSTRTPEDVVPSLELSGGVTLTDVHRDGLADVMAGLSLAEDRAVVESAIAEEVWYDKVVSIIDMPNPKAFVYDLTVRETRTFAIYNGQMAMDTFHLSGVSTSTKVTSGVPRMKELMAMSKNIKTPSMTIRLRREWATSQSRAQTVLSSIETTMFRDLVRRSSVHFDPGNDSGDTAVAEDAALMAFYREFGALDGNAATCDPKASPWLLRFEFDRGKMHDLKVTMLDVEATLVNHYDDTISCVLSDDNAARLVCRLRLAAMPAEKQGDLLTELKALEQSIMDNIVVKGIPRINKAVPRKPETLERYDAASDAFVASDEWSIMTDGSNMVEVMGHPCVDYACTFTNDVYEVYQVLGIEAARQVLINEMRGVLGDSPLDHRHLSLLADTMSNRGFFMSIDRHGINNRGELGPLAKCSFEQTTDMLIKAGIFAERDRINGVSANIMLGQIAPCGTGDCEVLMDGERLVAMAREVAVPTDGRSAASASASASAAGPSSAATEMPALTIDAPAPSIAPAPTTSEDPSAPAHSAPAEGTKPKAAPRKKKAVGITIS